MLHELTERIWVLLERTLVLSKVRNGRPRQISSSDVKQRIHERFEVVPAGWYLPLDNVLGSKIVCSRKPLRRNIREVHSVLAAVAAGDSEVDEMHFEFSIEH